MLLSIVTATYNRTALLKKNYVLLKKLQNCFKFEWVIVCETKDIKTINFLNKIKKEKFIKIVTGRFDSADKAYNAGFKQASGKYINIHGDDDFFDIKNFSIIKNYLTKDKKWIIGHAEYFDNKFKKIRKLTSLIKGILLKNFNSQIFLIINYVMTPSVFFQKKLIKKVGGYDDKILYGSDYIFWLRFNKLFKPLIITKTISYVIFNSQTKTGSFDLNRYIVFLNLMKKFTSNPIIRFCQILSIIFIIIINYVLKKVFKVY